MDALTFKKGLGCALAESGFTRYGKSFRRDAQGVTTLISVEQGFGFQWFINVGFCLHGIGGTIPERIEKAHMYFRLERLFPVARETVLTAGALDDAHQPSAYQDLIALLGSELGQSLSSLGTEDALRSALTENLLAIGIVTRQAREYLSGPRTPSP